MEHSVTLRSGCNLHEQPR